MTSAKGNMIVSPEFLPVIQRVNGGHHDGFMPAEVNPFRHNATVIIRPDIVLQQNSADIPRTNPIFHEFSEMRYMVKSGMVRYPFPYILRAAHIEAGNDGITRATIDGLNPSRAGGCADGWRYK